MNAVPKRFRRWSRRRAVACHGGEGGRRLLAARPVRRCFAGEVDLSRLILSNDAGVFARLRDVDVFNQVYVDGGAVT